jgi:hypothetical protein
MHLPPSDQRATAPSIILLSLVFHIILSLSWEGGTAYVRTYVRTHGGITFVLFEEYQYRRMNNVGLRGEG